MQDEDLNWVWPQRSAPVHRVAHKRWAEPVIQFVTVCTKGRLPVLASRFAHQHVLEAWKESPGFAVGSYVIMPDHIHFFCSPRPPPEVTLLAWVQFWKGQVSRRLNKSELARHFTGSVWQRHFWDTQLRAHESYQTKWTYVRMNPVRAGLAASPEDWPYQGRVEDLVWSM